MYFGKQAIFFFSVYYTYHLQFVIALLACTVWLLNRLFAHATNYLLPDRPSPSYTASRSGDRQVLCSSETACDGI